MVWLFASQAMSREMSLDECLHKTYTENRSLTVERYEAEIKENLALSTFAKLFPRVYTQSRLTAWDSPLRAKINAARSFQPLDPVLDEISSELGQPQTLVTALNTYHDEGNFNHSIKLRNQFTLEMNVTAEQPITDLFGTYFQYKAYNRLRDASKLEASLKRDELAEKVISAYFGLIYAAEIKEYSRWALQELETWLGEERTEKFQKKAPSVPWFSEQERFELENLKESYQRFAIRAEYEKQVATAALHALMDDNSLEDIVPVMPDLPDENLLSSEENELVERCIAQRPDFVGLRKRISAHRALRNVALGEFIPKFSLFGSYEYRVGQGQLLPNNLYYGGVALDWSIWEWGSTYYQLAAVNAELERQQAELDAQKDGVQVDIAKARAEAVRAKETLELVESGYERATANFFAKKNAFLEGDLSFDSFVRGWTALLHRQQELARIRNIRYVALYRLKLTVGELILVDPEKLIDMQP